MKETRWKRTVITTFTFSVLRSFLISEIRSDMYTAER